MYLNSSLEDDVQATKRLRLTWDVFKWEWRYVIILLVGD